MSVCLSEPIMQGTVKEILHNFTLFLAYTYCLIIYLIIIVYYNVLFNFKFCQYIVSTLLNVVHKPNEYLNFLLNILSDI